MKTQIIAIIVLALTLYSCKNGGGKGDLNTEEGKVSYGIGLMFEPMLEEAEKSMPLDENANVDDFIKGIESVVNGSKGKSLSYMQGINVGYQIQSYLKSLNATDSVNYSMIYKGIRDKYNKDSILIPQDSIGPLVQNYFKTKQEKFQKEQQKNQKDRVEREKAENLKKSDEFLEKNKSQQGVQTTDTGLQYKVLKQGNGDTPTKNDKVKVIYKGKLLDGTEFDNSQGKPREFNLNAGVIPGFSEGIMKMNRGSKYVFYIPPTIGYGENGNQNIGPNEVLEFEVELVDFAPIPQEELDKMKKAQQQQQEMLKKQLEAQMKQQQAAQGQAQ